MGHKKLLNEWQKRLSMQDWRVFMKENCKPSEMSVDESSGCISWQESSKTAYMQIIDPEYYGERVIPFDFEKTLVHELLHLKFCLFYDEDGEVRERLVHQTVDDLARALVDAKRYKNDEEDIKVCFTE